MTSDIIDFLLSSPLLEKLIASIPLPFAAGVDGKIRLESDAYRDSPERAVLEAKFSSSSEAFDDASPEEPELMSDFLSDKNVVLLWRINFCEAELDCQLSIPLETDIFVAYREMILKPYKRLLAITAKKFFDRDAINFETLLSFICGNQLSVNTVIECASDKTREFLIDILRAMSEGGASRLVYIDADFFASKSGAENLRTTLEKLVGGSKTLIISDPEKLPLDVQEDLAFELSRLKFALADGGERPDLKFLSISGADISSLADKGEFSSNLLDILQTKKIIMNTKPRSEAIDNMTRASLAADKKSVCHGEGADYSNENDLLSPLSSNTQGRIGDSERDQALPEPPEDGQHERRDDYSDLDIEKSIEDAERKCVLKALRLSNGRKDRAAKLLKMNLRTFHRRCARLGI